MSHPVVVATPRPTPTPCPRAEAAVFNALSELYRAAKLVVASSRKHGLR